MSFLYSNGDRVHRKWIMEMLTLMPTHRKAMKTGDTVVRA